MREIQIYENADNLCAEMVEAMIATSTFDPVHIALSGGSTPTLLFEKMAEYDDPDVLRNMHFYWVDERHVPEDDPESNYGVFRRLLVDTGIVSEENVHPIKYHPDIHQMAANYEQELRQLVPFMDDLPVFDEIILGVGEDGHTASIFPDRLDLFETTDIVATTRHSVTGQGRVTLTGSTINNAYEVAVLCLGKRKRRILDEVLRENKPEYPISHVKLLLFASVIFKLDLAASCYGA
jgi:6-phosphogluconolactonase